MANITKLKIFYHLKSIPPATNLSPPETELLLVMRMIGVRRNWKGVEIQGDFVTAPDKTENEKDSESDSGKIKNVKVARPKIRRTVKAKVERSGN